MPDSKAYNRLKLKEFKLDLLLEITKAINNNVPTHRLFEIFQYTLRHQLNIGKLILFSFDGEKWKNVLKYGVKGSTKVFNVKEDLEHIKDITVIESSSKEHLSTFEIVIPVYHKSNPLAFLLLGDIDEDALKVSPVIKHMPFIQTLTNIIVVAIENKRLAKESIKQERTKKELELASEMQSMLIPDKLPDNVYFQIDAFYQPHQQVGGDYYDYIELNENESVFCVADVSGKGVSAALLMANFQAKLRAWINFEKDLTSLVQVLNEKVNESAKGEKYITLFLAKYNKKTRELRYINAAHNAPILLSNNETSLLKKGCTGIGMFDTIPTIEEGIVHINPNSILMCYTDGVVELENNTKEEFGNKRLREFLLKHSNLSVPQINFKLIAELQDYKEDQKYSDDIALFTCRFF